MFCSKLTCFKVWEQRQLENLLEVNSGKDYKHLEKGNIPVYGTSGYMLSVNKSLSEKDAIGIGRKGTIDKPQFLKAPFWTVDTLFFLTLKYTNDLNFIYYKFQNINWKKYDESTGVPSLTKNTINKIKISIPIINEQTKIKKLFKLLDNLITLYEKKYQQLKILKIGLLQNIFNNLSTLDTVQLKQICTLKQWKTISSHEMQEEGYPVYGANGIIGHYYKYNHEKPTICITCRGATSGNVLISKPYSYITGNAMCIDNLNSDFNSKFLYEYLNFRGLKDVVTGSAQPQITSSLLGIVKVPVISLNNQKNISNILSTIDLLISNVKEKYNYLKKIKQTFLNTMFI